MGARSSIGRTAVLYTVKAPDKSKVPGSNPGVPTTKICRKCRQRKKLLLFVRKNANKSGYSERCKQCMRTYAKQHYFDNKAAYRNRNLLYKPGVKMAIAEKLTAIRSAPCMDCKKTYHPFCMDFDHRVGTSKVASISYLVKHDSWETIKQELAKCDLVCSNCHRLRTWKRWGRRV